MRTETASVEIATAPRRFARWLAHEGEAIAPSAIFFLAGFGLILLMVKLFVAQYSIELRVISNAIVGALIAAKVSLILDRLDWARSHGYPRAVVVAGKVTGYTICVVVLGLAEHMIDGWRESGSFHGGLLLFDQRFHASRFFAIVMCVAILFTIFFVMQEVNRRLGAGQMYELFFERPRAR